MPFTTVLLLSILKYSTNYVVHFAPYVIFNNSTLVMEQRGELFIVVLKYNVI